MREPRTSEELFAAQKLATVVRALLAGEVDVLRAAQEIAGCGTTLDPKHEDPELRTFAGIASDTDVHLIIDSEKGWHPAARASRDAEYDEANEFYKSHALKAAAALLAKLSPPA